MDRRTFIQLAGATSFAGMIPTLFAGRNVRQQITVPELKHCSVELQRYINSNSIVHQIIYPEKLPCGAIPRYEPDDSHCSLEEVSVLVRTEKEIKKGKDWTRDGDIKYYTGKELDWTSKKGEKPNFCPPTWEHSVYQKTSYELITEDYKGGKMYSDTLHQPDFDELKVKFLNQQELLFIELLRYATKKAGTYYNISDPDRAFWYAMRIKYDNVWIGKKYKNHELIRQLWGKQRRLNSENLNGIILTEYSPQSIGGYALRQEPCILPSFKEKVYVAYEDVAMFVIGKNITFIEIG